MLMEFLEILTIGLPFCAFKCVSGLFFRNYLLVVLGLIDLAINIINLLSLTLKKRRLLDACLFSFIVRLVTRPAAHMKSKWQDLGNSLDVLLSFSLVAYMIGGGFIKSLSIDHLFIWNVSVILNVFGAGSSRLTTSIKNLRPEN
jgi:hypothetical protein